MVLLLSQTKILYIWSPSPPCLVRQCTWLVRSQTGLQQGRRVSPIQHTAVRGSTCMSLTVFKIYWVHSAGLPLGMKLPHLKSLTAEIVLFWTTARTYCSEQRPTMSTLISQWTLLPYAHRNSFSGWKSRVTWTINYRHQLDVYDHKRYWYVWYFY